MATINTSHAKARIIVNMLLECGVTFGYSKDLQNSSPNHQDVIEVSDGRRELLAECLRLASGTGWLPGRWLPAKPQTSLIRRHICPSP